MRGHGAGEVEVCGEHGVAGGKVVGDEATPDVRLFDDVCILLLAGLEGV